MKISAVSLLSLCFLPALLPARAAEPVKIPMTADYWKTEGSIAFVQYNGADAIELKPGNRELKVMTGQAILNDFTFRSGTIEYDVDATSGMGAAFAFRQRDKDTYELFYLRPRPKCSEAIDCIQYAPQTHGILLWDLFPQYQSPAPLREGEWNHIKLVISGRRMNVFINGTQAPSLKVGNLEGDALEGGLMLQGPGIFANLTVTPDAVEGLSSEPEKDPTAADSRYVRNWQVAPYSTLATDHEPSIAELPAASTDWTALVAERGGLVNVSRKYGLPLTRPDRGVVWLKTTIHSQTQQQKRVSIGWSRELWFFVNGKLVYADKNLYQPPSARKTPDGRCSLENGSFLLPLNKGDNEVAVAIADNFYGWALILRLDDVKGVRLAGK